jgi:broad specificity phosphatase PhoE
MNWYFIRHGQIASNLKKVYSGRSDEALTEAGREQVRQASSQLAEIAIDAIYSSPLTRTQQTAEIIAHELDWNLPINSDDSFNELKMGPWEGMPETDVETRFPDEWTIWNSRPADLQMDDRETLVQLQDRVLDGMRAIQESHPDHSILIVTHVAIIRVISLFANSLDLNLYKTVPVDNARVFNFGWLEL